MRRVTVRRRDSGGGTRLCPSGEGSRLPSGSHRVPPSQESGRAARLVSNCRFTTFGAPWATHRGPAMTRWQVYNLSTEIEVYL